MWKKIEIINKSISEYRETGFILNIGKNTISNIDKTIFIKLPFKIHNINNLYNFELFFNKDNLKLFLYINLNEIEDIVYKNRLIPHKNNLFIILKTYLKDKKTTSIKFRKTNNINNILDKIEISKYYNENSIILGKLLFNIDSETITKNKFFNDLLTLDLYYVFFKKHKIEIDDNMLKKYRVCIVDDCEKYQNCSIINRNNCYKITKSFILTSNFIVIDKKLFTSNRYIKDYKYFHTNIGSVHAFNNYKDFISNQNNDYKTINVEIFDSFVFIFNNINIAELNNHPFIYSNSRKIFTFDNVDQNIINDCEKFTSLFNKKKHNRDKIHPIYNKSYYLDIVRFGILHKISNPDILIVNNFDFNIPTSFQIMYFPINEMCYINYIKIGFNCNVLLSCNHRFITTNIDIFINKLDTCPYCGNKIKNMNVFVYSSNMLKDLFSDSFFDVYNNSSEYFHIILKKYSKKFKDCVNQIYKNIIFVDDYKDINISKPFILYSSIDIKYDIIDEKYKNLVKLYILK